METILKLENLTVTYPHGFKKEKIAIDGVNLEIAKGKILGLWAPTVPVRPPL